MQLGRELRREGDLDAGVVGRGPVAGLLGADEDVFRRECDLAARRS